MTQIRRFDECLNGAVAISVSARAAAAWAQRKVTRMMEEFLSGANSSKGVTPID